LGLGFFLLYPRSFLHSLTSISSRQPGDLPHRSREVRSRKAAVWRVRVSGEGRNTSAPRIPTAYARSGRVRNTGPPRSNPLAFRDRFVRDPSPLDLTECPVEQAESGWAPGPCWQPWTLSWITTTRQPGLRCFWAGCSVSGRSSKDVFEERLHFTAIRSELTLTSTFAKAPGRSASRGGNSERMRDSCHGYVSLRATERKLVSVVGAPSSGLSARRCGVRLYPVPGSTNGEVACAG
jgi:hypothetical protein